MEAALGWRELLLLLAAALLVPAVPLQLGQWPECFATDLTNAPEASMTRHFQPKGKDRSQCYDVENQWRISQRTGCFNITYVNGQVYLNDFPMKSGVAHITCQTVILENGNSDNLPDQQRLGTVSVRIMVHEWPLASSSDLQLIVIQEEVTEIDGKQVQQEEVTEIDILVKDLRVLRHSNYTVPLKESMLYSIPRDNDMLFTLPNLSGKDIQDPLQTTSQYLIRQVETTIDEETLPGKLPETPLRIEPPSSYKVMCQWVEDLRKALCRFWFRSLPIFFSLMEVIVVGVVGAALILKVLKVMFLPVKTKASFSWIKSALYL